MEKTKPATLYVKAAEIRKRNKFVKIVYQIVGLFILVEAAHYSGFYRGHAITEKYYSNCMVIDPFILPVNKKDIIKITSTQGLRDIVSDGENQTEGKYHNGVDISLKVGTKVFATKDGYAICVYPGKENGGIWKGHPVYGGLIILKHYDGTITLYAHLSDTKIHEGEEVKAGQIIGYSGGEKNERASGISTGPHLHYAVYVNLEDLVLDYKDIVNLN